MIRNLVLIFLLAILLSGCYNGRLRQYSNQRLTNDMQIYENNLRELIKIAKGDGKLAYRVFAINEIAKYSENKAEEARNIVLYDIVPAMVEILNNEKEDVAKGALISTLVRINPGKDIMLPIYKEILESGGKVEVINAIKCLKENNYELSKYGYKYLRLSRSELISDRIIGIKALGAMGRYAKIYVSEMKMMMTEEKYDQYEKGLIEEAINMIEEDYILCKES